jgi:oligopeptide transport system substrate-binding protein
VRWSDGVELKAEDFVYSWRRLLSPETAASYAYFLFDVEGAEDFYKGRITDFSQVGIRALDPGTLQVRLVKPVSYWISIPTFWVTFPLREDVVRRHGADWERPGKMVTLGAFTLVDYRIDSRIVLEANPAYHGQRGDIRRAEGLIVKDDSTAMTLYETGKFDFLTDLSSLDLKRMAGNPELKAFPYLKTAYLGFVIRAPGVADPRVRRAIAMAIDKSRIAGILYGGQRAATSWVPPGVLGHSEALGLPYDPVAARRELRAAGVRPPLRLELLTPSRDRNLVLSQFLQSELKKNLGIELEIQAFDNKTFRSQVALKRSPLYLLSWSGDYPDPDNFVSVFTGDSGNNRTGWADAAYDGAVTRGRSLAEPREREKVYFAAQKLLLEGQAVIVPLFYEPNMALVRSRVEGLELNPLNYLLLRQVRLRVAP